MTKALLRVEGLRVQFAGREVVRGVDLEVLAGETVGLVGESGAGKSTLARAILRLVRARSGSVRWCGEEILDVRAARLRTLRRDLQLVFQDPLSSLNPRMTVGRAIAEPLEIFEPRLKRSEVTQRVGAMLERVGLTAGMGGRYPHEMSGGQCQRVGIARAVILTPKLLICDEPVSALDVSIQGQIVNLLADLQKESGMAMLFISHNLGVVRHVSRRILVMYGGRCVESGACEEILNKPLHPYSAALLRAAKGEPPVAAAHSAATPAAGIPLAGIPLAGVPLAGTPSAATRSAAMAEERAMSGCPYAARCTWKLPICEAVDPPFARIGEARFAACHRAAEFWDLAPVP